MPTQSHKQAYAGILTPDPLVSSNVLTAVDYLLGHLYGERATLLSPAIGTLSSSTKSPQPIDQTAMIISDLDRSIERLENIKKWLSEDRQLLALVDGAIGRHVQQMERQAHRFDVRLALTTTIGGAVLGWFLAAISSPHDLLQLLGH